MKMSGARKAVVRWFSRAHAALYARVGGGRLAGTNVLVLTTNGRKSGRERSIPLLYVQEGAKLYLVASYAGNDSPPAWFLNLVANPRVRVLVGGETRSLAARPLSTEEAAPIWPKLLALWPAYASYQKKTTRIIPVVELS